MFLSDLSIKRPVFSVALSLIIVVVGLLSYANLEVQNYPNVDEAILTVETLYAGAAPAIVESKVTNCLENTLSSTPRLDYMTSTSETGKSSIILHFRGGTRLSDAASDVRERIAEARALLPKEAKEPTVMKDNANARPFMYLDLTSSSRSELELYDYANRHLKGIFETLPGVGGVEVWGNAPSMQIRFDREKLKAYNLSIIDILDTLKDNTQELPAGNIVKGKRHVNVIVEGSLTTPHEMQELILSSAKNHIVRLKDVASVFLARDTKEDVSIPYTNNKPSVFVGIKRASDGNTLAISTSVLKHVEHLRKTMPADMHLEEAYNMAMFIEAAIKAVKITIFEAIFLVLMIILFFLHSPRAAFIPLITIPVSLIGSFVFLYAFHCSINTLTLLAMVLAIGLVVDDAIVVLENIHRHIEKGLTPLEAAFIGAREVGFVVIAMTITLASVYAPIAFVQGLTGKLFAEFAVALAGAVLISGVVALTLSPMMCAYLLRPHTEPHAIGRWINNFLATLDMRYKHALLWALSRPKLLCGLLGLTLMVGGFLFTRLPSTLAPQEDESIVMLFAQGPQGATLDSMASYTEQINALFESVPEKKDMWSVTQRSGIFGGITLVPWDKRTRTQSEIIDELRKKARKIAGLQVSVFPWKNILSGGEAGIEMAVKTTRSYGDLEREMDKFVKVLKHEPCFEEVRHDLFLTTPQLNVQIDRSKAALLGLTIKDIARTLEVMLNGDRSLTFEKDGQNYDIVVQSHDNHKKDLRDIGHFYINPTTLDEEGGGAKADKEDKSKPPLVPLRDVASIREVAVSTNIQHLNKMRSATVNADLAPSYQTSDALATLETAARKTLPADCELEPMGGLRQFLESQGDMYMIFGASLLFIYLILAIQFESFLDPLLIMLTVPLSIVGALLTLYLAGGSLNIFSQIGLITLVGLITKHGILLVEFANKQREAGLSIREAALNAAALRMRPILMTTGAMVLGALPLAIAMGAGAASRQQIGWVLVGGLLGGTFFTLFVVPFVYIAVKSAVQRKKASCL